MSRVRNRAERRRRRYPERREPATGMVNGHAAGDASMEVELS
jgi:hypothetical protein